MKKYINIFIIALVLSPTVAFAQPSASLTGIKGLITAVRGLINPLIGVLVGAALLVFFWGLARFIFRLGGDEKAVEEGKRIMKWGLIALFVMVSVRGIIGFFQDALLPGGGSTPPSSAPSTPPSSPSPFPISV